MAAWTAGVLDALGVFRERSGPGGGPGGTAGRAAVFVHTPDLALLEELARATGTRSSVVERSFPRAGCAQHCREKHVHVRSRSGRWSVTGARALVVCRGVLPHLRVEAKREACAALLTSTSAAPAKMGLAAGMADLGWDVGFAPPVAEGGKERRRDPETQRFLKSAGSV